MDQSDQNTPAQQEPAIDDSKQLAATPGLGLAKGIVAISLGVVAFTQIALSGLLAHGFFWAMFYGWQDSYDDLYFDYGFLITGIVMGAVIFGLCLWRGILAIRYRKVRRVTPLNFGLWLGFFILIVLPVIGFTLVGLILLA